MEINTTPKLDWVFPPRYFRLGNILLDRYTVAGAITHNDVSANWNDYEAQKSVTTSVTKPVTKSLAVGLK